jgi:hypothetical protein
MNGELAAPPRRLRLRPGTGCEMLIGLWFVRLFILPHTLAGIYLLLTVVFLPIVWLFGTDINGQITDLTTSKSKGKTFYHVSYVYTVNGVDYPRQTSVAEDVYPTLQKGQEYRVRVFWLLPGTMPQQLGPGSTPGNDALGTILAALGWNAFIAVITWFVWIRPWRMRQLVKHGTRTSGLVVGKDVVPGKSSSYKIRYSYQAPLPPTDEWTTEMTMASFNGKMDVTKTDFDQSFLGQAVTVIYHPRRPKRSVAYDFCPYVAVES